MNDEHFGSCLRRAREDRALTIGDVSASTKVPRSALEMLESGALAGSSGACLRSRLHPFLRQGGRHRRTRSRSACSIAPSARRRRRRSRESAVPVVDPRSPAGGVPEDARRRESSPRARAGGVRDHLRAHRDDHAVAAAPPAAAVGRRAEHRLRRPARTSTGAARDDSRSRATAAERLRVDPWRGSDYNADAHGVAVHDPRSSCAP